MTGPPSIASESERLTAELERLRPGLRIIALRALGDPDAVDDAVQETLVRAVAAIEQGRLADPARLASYVAGIARHVCFHVVRDRKETVDLEGHRDERPDPLESLISASELARLRAAFQTLSAQEQHLLREHFGGDELAGAASDRVRKQKSRALQKLRRAFFGRTGHELPPRGTNEQ